MTGTVSLSIVFLNYNKIEETRITLRKLQALCNADDGIEIIAVDNGSTDGTAELLTKQTFVKSILLPDNTGIAGYNAGFTAAKGEFILVLDDDSAPESLTALQQTLKRLQQNPATAIIACRILSPDGTEQWSWHLPKTNQYGESPFFIGCGFIIRREVFKKIGWYPASFFLYQNEAEVSFLVRLLGFKIDYDPECIVIHRGIPNQRPGKRRVFYPTRNTLWLIRKFYPQPKASYMIVSRLLIGLVRALQFQELPAYFKAAAEGLQQPVQKKPLPKHLQKKMSPFWQQNSLLHILWLRKK